MRAAGSGGGGVWRRRTAGIAAGSARGGSRRVARRCDCDAAAASSAVRVAGWLADGGRCLLAGPAAEEDEKREAPRIRNSTVISRKISLGTAGAQPSADSSTTQLDNQ